MGNVSAYLLVNNSKDACCLIARQGEKTTTQIHKAVSRFTLGALQGKDFLCAFLLIGAEIHKPAFFLKACG